MDAAFNVALYQYLADWNPMKFEDKTMGDQEVYDCMDIIHQKQSRNETVAGIKDIYRFNFDADISDEEINHILDEIEKIQATCQL